jgi:hypothetical protein
MGRNAQIPKFWCIIQLLSKESLFHYEMILKG